MSSAISEIVSSINLRIQRSRESLRSSKNHDNKSDSGSVKSNNSIGSFSSFRRRSLFGHKRSNTAGSNFTANNLPTLEQEPEMAPPILRDAETTTQLLQVIHDHAGGKRSVARLARTCKALKEPSLNVLWKDLDSILPLVGLFPANIMKRPKRPALGLNKMPVDADWKDLLAYGNRVKSLTYEESAHNVPTSIFPVFEDRRPRAWILPNLSSLVWRCETPAGLDRARIFMSPQLKTLTLEVGYKFTNLSEFLVIMGGRTRLTDFTIVSPSVLPEDFTEIMKPQDRLEKLSLMAPGALSSKVGKWVSGIDSLKTLELDLVGKPMSAVESFFDEITPRSGTSTPDSVASRDSGVFSADELDFTEVKKPSSTGRRVACGQLRNLRLTGEAGNIAMFLKHLTGHIHSLELVIEDPPDEYDWQDMCTVICEQFAYSLRTLKISATGSSRFVDLARSTSKVSSLPLKRLPLQHLTSLPKLTCLDIDLPQSVIFENADIEHLARVCPDVEIIRLCPVARYPTSMGPALTLEGIAPLTSGCKRLHTLSLVVNAKPASEAILHSLTAPSKSLTHLHVGHSHLKDPLQAAIFLSHIAPFLDNLKWLQERTRSGSLDMNTGGWQKVCELLPHLQSVRAQEKRMAASLIVLPPVTRDASVDASVISVDSEVQAVVETSECEIQWSPIVEDKEIEAIPETEECGVDATPEVADAHIDAVTVEEDPIPEALELTPAQSNGLKHALVSASRYVEAALNHAEGTSPTSTSEGFPVPTVRGVVMFPFRVVRAYTYYATYPIRCLLSPKHTSSEAPVEDEKFLVPVSAEKDTSSPVDHETSSVSSGEGMDFNAVVAHI